MAKDGFIEETPREKIVDRGYHYLGVRDVIDAWQPKFVMFSEEERTLRICQVVKYEYKYSRLTRVSLRFEDGSEEEVEAKELDKRLFIHI